MFLSSVPLDLTYNKWQQYSHGQWAEIINIPKYASVNNIPEKRKFQTTEDGRLVQLKYRFKLRTLKTYFDFLHRKLLCSSFSNHNMKWERKVHKIGLLRRFMRIPWTLNSSTRRYLDIYAPSARLGQFYTTTNHMRDLQSSILWVSSWTKLVSVQIPDHILFTWLWESWSSRNGWLL